ncbi:DUF421 domain-containing protein [Paenibacillus sp. J45TS6]|uniref:DUF421 domain-containing protein n=1 Tax=Paenibacillus sp. J45TS6 TaxID=2807196 RepID=UPI001B05A076|nr:DUF421 domain-containing protein [Paenibacillus sp. J45TS6]GIP42871.1 DUF421 domain-containing protein [Paenibacillus sp. J45TS6]
MDEYGLLLIKLITAFTALWAATRLLGKREITQLSPFDFISALVFGDLVGDTIYDEEVSVWKLIFSLAIWALLSYVFDKIMGYSKPLREKFEGNPDLLIKNGEIDMEAMKRNKVEFEELKMMMRQQNVFSLSEVAYAVYETNGSLSILKKSDSDQSSRNDLGLDTKPVQLPRTLIVNSKPNREALAAIHRDEKWLLTELAKQGYHTIDSVFYAEWTEDGEVQVIDHYQSGNGKKHEISF